MRILVIGAVAAGTSAAAKARRNDSEAEIVIYEKDKDISYAGCGLPYYIGGVINDLSDITPRNVSFFKMKYNIEIFTRHEVLKIDPEKNEISVKNQQTNEIFKDSYDKLVIATGAFPFIPHIKGVDRDNVFSLRNVQNAMDIKDFIKKRKPREAVIVGTGFIGFEMLENLMRQDIHVTMIEKQNKITPNLDEHMASLLEKMLAEKNISFVKGTSIAEIQDGRVILENGDTIACEIVIMAAGVKPNVSVAKDAGLEMGVTGAIKVNNKMQTSIPNIYACGDCIETFSSITNKPVYRPLGSTANKTGRIAGETLTGGNLQYKGSLGTNIFKLFDMTIASTGLSEKEALDEGYEIIVSMDKKVDKTNHFNGKHMHIKAIADKKSHRLLGVQIIGHDGVDKRIDVFASLITFDAKVEDLFHLDLAYAPPYSTAKDPIHYTGMILEKNFE